MTDASDTSYFHAAKRQLRWDILALHPQTESVSGPRERAAIEAAIERSLHTLAAYGDPPLTPPIEQLDDQQVETLFAWCFEADK